MRTIYLRCQKCNCILGTAEETDRGLCTICYGKAIRSLSEKFPEGKRESLMDDFIAPVDLGSRDEVWA